MQFHVQIKVYDAIVLDGDKRLRETLGPQLQKVMQSGKVRSSGLLGGIRGAFFIVDIEDAAELFDLFGPEVYGNCQVEAHPVVPIERAGEMFHRWAQEGR